MIDVQETKNIFQRSQVALKVASIVCGVISLLLFIAFLFILFGKLPAANPASESSNLVTAFVIYGSIGLVGFAFNFAVLDYALRARIKELPALAEEGAADSVIRFSSKIKTHAIVLLIFGWLGVAQVVYALVLFLALPVETPFLFIGTEWELLTILVGLTPSLVHLKLAKTLGDESKILLAQLN